MFLLGGFCGVLVGLRVRSRIILCGEVRETLSIPVRGEKLGDFWSFSVISEKLLDKK